MKKRDIGSQLAIYPLPIKVITTYDKAGKANAMIGGWGGIVNSRPRMVSIAVREETHTYEGLMANQGFVISMPTADFIDEIAYFGKVSGKDEDKFAKTGLTALPSNFVKAPIIDEMPINIECRVVNTINIGSHIEFIAEVVNVKVDTSYDEEKPLIEQLDPIMYSPNSNHTFYKMGQGLTPHPERFIDID